MLEGLGHVWRAAEILAGGDAGLRQRLKGARAELGAALRRPEQWPPDLLGVARSLDRLLGGPGEDDPLDTLDAGLAGRVAEDLLSLAVDVLLAFREAGGDGPAARPGGPQAQGLCRQPAGA